MRTHRPLTTVALALALFMAALEMTVVSTAMPTVIGDLGGIDRYAWVFTAYMLASTITVPVFGKLADQYGRKPILLFGLVVFLIGSTASGLSPSMNWLIAFRTLQGIGAGAIQPIVLTIIGDIYTLEERARIQGVFSGVWGLAGLAGPLAGAKIVEYLSWHWVFFINVPVGLGVMVLIVLFFHETLEKKPHVIDRRGAALLTVGMVALLVGVQSHGLGLLALPAGAAVLFAFFLVELRVPEPIIPMNIFAIRAVSVGAAVGAFFSAAQFGATTYVPLFVQGVLGGTATQAGGMITPMLVGWPLASLIAAPLMTRIGFRPLIVGGLGLATTSTVLMATLLRPGAPLLVPELAMGVLGAGLGFAAIATLIAAQTSVGWEVRGVVTAGTMFFRTVGGTLGVGLMGGVLAARLEQDPRIPANAANALLGPEHGHGLAPDLLRELGGALNTGLRIDFWLVAVCAAAAFASGLFFPKVTPSAQKLDGGAAIPH